MDISILQDELDKYQVGLTHVLEAVGHPEAFVTDLAQVLDFLIFESEEQVLFNLSDLLGRDVLPYEFIWMLAKEVEEKVL